MLQWGRGVSAAEIAVVAIIAEAWGCAQAFEWPAYVGVVHWMVMRTHATSVCHTEGCDCERLWGCEHHSASRGPRLRSSRR